MAVGRREVAAWEIAGKVVERIDFGHFVRRDEQAGRVYDIRLDRPGEEKPWSVNEIEALSGRILSMREAENLERATELTSVSTAMGPAL